jgi:imidazole glycerol-phosphate synthase subunit HisF
MDVKRVGGRFRVFAKGGREDTGLDALEWVKFGEQSGAGEVVVNSIDTDGVRGGFDLEMLASVGDAVRLPLIASGGAGRVEDFIELFRLPRVDAGLAASIFHSHEVDIRELKRMLKESGVPMRV